MVGQHSRGTPAKKYVWKQPGHAKTAAIIHYNRMLWWEWAQKYGQDFLQYDSRSFTHYGLDKRAVYETTLAPRENGKLFSECKIHSFVDQNRLEIHKMALQFVEVCK